MRQLGHIFLTAGLLLCLTLPTRADEKVKAGDLVGAWVRASKADISGMEFTKEGKVLLYFGGANQAETGDYSILDDGRLNLALGGALNNFFLPTLTGDQLQLKDPDSGKIALYRKLKASETMAQAIVGQDKADQQALQNRNAALPNFLNRQDLVMVVVNPPANAPSPCALQWSATSNVDYSGHAYFDSKPPHVEIVGAQIQGANTDGSTSVAIWFGPGTAQQNGGRGVWLFHVTGNGADMALTSQINFGEAFGTGPNSTVIVKPDAAMYKNITTAMQGEAARLETLKTPIMAMLKDYVVLKGTSQSALPAERDGFADQFVLSRNAQTSAWTGQGQSTNRKTGATEIFPVMAAVGIANDKPVVQILSQKRLYQFSTIDTAGGKLSGIWAVPRTPNGHAAELAIIQAVDGKARDQLFATRKAALQKIAAGTVFHGLLNDQYTNNSQPPNPVAVTLSMDDKGTITGKAEYVLEGCTMDLKGKEVDTPLGPQLVIQYTDGQASPTAWNDVKQFITLVQHETWTLSAEEDSSGALRLNGFAVTNPTPSAIPITLQLIPFGDKEKADITKALTDGSHFKVTMPQMGNAPDTILDFIGDPAGGKINGNVAAGGTHLGARPGTKCSGEIKDQNGWTALDMPLASGKPKPDYAYFIVVTPTDSGLYINGFVYSTHIGIARPLGRWDAVQVKQ